jgi:hypothetical protein
MACCVAITFFIVIIIIACVITRVGATFVLVIVIDAGDCCVVIPFQNRASASAISFCITKYPQSGYWSGYKAAFEACI